jgi:transketolase
MKMAFEVANALEKEHRRSVAVVSAHTLKPLDAEGVARILTKYAQVIVIEEHSERGGLAAMVKQIAWDRRAPCALHTFSLKDEFIHEFGSHADLLKAHGLSTDQILTRVTGG